MRLKARDLVGTVLVIAVAVPYIGYLVNGSMPWVADAQSMAVVALLVAFAAYVVIQRYDPDDVTDRVEIGLEDVSLGLGLAAVVFAETAYAEVLLAVFMGSILIVWAIKLMDHAGVLPMAQHPSGTI